MTADEFDRLAQDVLDGVAPPEEARRLEDIVAREPVFRERYREWKEIFVSLRDVPEEDPPPTLRQDVLREIRLRVSGHGARHEVLLRRFLRDGSALGPLRSLALPFVSGLGVGAVIVGLLMGGLDHRLEGDRAVGAMVSGPETAPGRKIEEKRLTVGSTQVRVTAFASPKAVLLRLEARSDEPVSVIVGDPSRAYRLAAFRRSDSDPRHVAISQGRIQIEHAGSGTYWLEFEVPGPPGRPLEVTLAAGRATVRETIRTGTVPAGR